MAVLSPEQRLSVITRLACFESPTEIQRSLKESGVEISLQGLGYYDPATAAGRDLPEELKELFHETRRRFVEDTASIGVSHAAYRLRQIQRFLDDPKYSRNPDLVMRLLEQAAKHLGGAYTNRRELTGKDGAPIQIAGPDLSRLTDDQLFQLETLLLATEAADAGGDPGGASAEAEA